MHSLEIIVYYLTKYSPHSLKKKKDNKTKHSLQCIPSWFWLQTELE